eukprot:RCo046888
MLQRSPLQSRLLFSMYTPTLLDRYFLPLDSPPSGAVFLYPSRTLCVASPLHRFLNFFFIFSECGKVTSHKMKAEFAAKSRLRCSSKLENPFRHFVAMAYGELLPSRCVHSSTFFVCLIFFLLQQTDALGTCCPASVCCDQKMDSFCHSSLCFSFFFISAISLFVLERAPGSRPSPWSRISGQGHCCCHSVCVIIVLRRISSHWFYFRCCAPAPQVVLFASQQARSLRRSHA